MPLQNFVRAMMLGGLLAATTRGQGVLSGTVVDPDGHPLESATIRASREGATIRDAVTGADGSFRISGISAGIYVVTVHRVGYRSAELAGIRVADGQTRALSVTLTQAPRQLSTIEVVTSPTAVDVGTTGLSVKFDRTYTELLPGARDASSLLALVPGSRKDQVWGGAPGVSNDYRLDGVSMNHPGLGGDFLAMSVDWIEAVEVKGLGAGAEFGNFQGGVINAITKSGTNHRSATLRTNYEAARWNATNLNYDERGIEQAGRREIGAEAGGPIVRDRLFYFAAGQFVDRQMRAPTITSGIFANPQSLQEEHQDARGMFKLTWMPTPTQRAEALVGATSARVEHDGVNGIDASDALMRVRQPAAYFTLSWTKANANGGLEARLGGFRASESRESYEGDDVPGIQAFQFGRQPLFQNAPFNERRSPSGLNGTFQRRMTRRFFGSEHQLAVGTDLGYSRWRDETTRNGGLTWRPYTIFQSSFDASAPATWATTASDWGGEVHLKAAMWSAALFAQDNIALGTRVTLTPGLRLSRWSGTLGGHTRETVAPAGVDERLGVSWDVTGRGTYAIKAHVGRYHQGMTALFFDRAEGANAYSDARYYSDGPNITDPRATFSVAQRDAPGSGFLPTYDVITLSESGRVWKYKQPYVDQFMLSFERSFGPKWKAELIGTTRHNGSIVGLRDRNAVTNYTAFYGVRVNNIFVPGPIAGPDGKPLVLPAVYISNGDLKGIFDLCAPSCARTIAGYDTAVLHSLPWNPDYVLTALPKARRVYNQATLLVRTVQTRWRGEASVTAARLEGNVAGVTGYGVAGDRFTPGPFARPTEADNFDGVLPDAQQFEGKLWVTGQIWHGFRAGMLYTHTYGERYTPEFQFQVRYAYRNASGPLDTELFRRLLGQSVLLEPRGSRHYASRDVVDLHFEWHAPARVVLAADVFNATGIDVITRVNTNVGDQSSTDPTSFFDAVRERVPPLTLRLGLRIQ